MMGCMRCRFFVKSFVARALLASGLLAATRSLPAADPQPVQPTDAIQKLVTELDAPEFFVREAAMRRLRGFVLDDGSGRPITAELERISHDARLSFETHERLAEVLRGVERANTAPRETLTSDQIDQLVAQLADDHFTERENAGRRLQRLLENESNIAPLMGVFKARLNDAHTASATRQELLRHYDAARRAWLLAPEGTCSLPEVSEAQIIAWVKLIGQPIDNEATFAAQRTATRELEDLMVRDDYRVSVTKLLEQQLAEAEDPGGKTRLRDLVDLTRPAMVAEIWTSAPVLINFAGAVAARDNDPFSVRLVTTQYLHVGIPQIPANAPRATHFDHCDDKIAHCVSGNTLLPGDYPVGTAIPHPEGETTIFHLINLPTPRRRLIYEYSARRSEAIRLRELSQRTCAALLNKERKLAEADAGILMLLDRAIVADFAGQFFSKVDDAPLAGMGGRLIVGHTSTHGAVCYALAFTGGKDAAPAIIKAITDNRILPPEEGSHYNLPLIALLAVAHRDPWDKVNDWLSEQLERDEPLVSNVDPAPELAATAAALLGDRLGQSPQSLGLVPVMDGFCQQIGLSTYRFEAPQRRDAFRAWLRAQRQEVARGKTG